jgi:hypothetical protein
MFLGGLVFLVAAALLSLNFPQLFFEPLPSWYRMADLALLVAGLLGSVLTSKRPELWMPRLALWLAFSILLVVCFRK